VQVQTKTSSYLLSWHNNIVKTEYYNTGYGIHWFNFLKHDSSANEFNYRQKKKK